MSTDRGPSVFPPRRRRDETGVALVVTLALLVLVTVTVVAFFSRTTTNQQITSGSSQGVMVTTFADGATQEIIAGLQKEMWDGSGQPSPVASPSPAPILLPMTNVSGINPSRMVGPNVPAFPTTGAATDPNAAYAQFANLVKQSYTGVATYNVAKETGGNATGPTIASGISTKTPSAGGRSHDGVYWNQPQLVSVPPASADLDNLVPYWVYTRRDGSHPTGNYTADMAQPAGGALSSTSVVGRYAYNIYDIGGLLNANLSGYGAIAKTQPGNSTRDELIVPGYKGSALMADLSGLSLGGVLSTNGANASSISGLQSKLSAYRYRQTGPKAFATLFGSGQHGGWLQPFLMQVDPEALVGTPTGSTLLTNYGFTSRQDLINWVSSQFPPPAAGGNSPAAWVLPYFTHFSYDTDAPTYTPVATRPQDTATVAAGGNDAGNLDPVINPGFNSPTAGASLNICDTNGYPLVKRRFPLSALTLFNNIYPGSPPATPEIAAQIKYDFGLVWNTAGNCWDYQDQNGGTAIKKLSDIAGITPTRSPNFFELLKAALTAGSLGKQWGEGYDNDPNFVLGGARSSTINFQILQIGANIISQSTTNYYPIDIHYTDNGNDAHFYGVKDLPYLYRSRIIHGTVGTYSAMGQMHSKGTNGPGYSKLGAVVLQPELWNPHAPNALPLAATYPTAFRVVAITVNPVPIRTYVGRGNGIAWEKPDGTTNATALASIIYGDFTGAGGPNLTNQASYTGGATPNAYIQFSCAAPGGANALNNYREPVPLAAPGFPDGTVTSSPTPPTLAVGATSWNGAPNTQVTVSTTGSTIPAVFSSAPTSNKILGFLMGYYCGGPGSAAASPNDPSSGYVLALTQVNPGGTSPAITTALQLQYSMDGTNFYPYDYMSCAIPSGNGNGSFDVGIGVQQTEVGTRIDPRTQRWGNAWARLSAGNSGPYGTSTVGTLYPGLTGTVGSDLTTNQGALKNPPGAPNWTLASYPAFGWLQINPGPGTPLYTAGTTSGAFYADPDGVYRPADDAYGASGNVVGLPEAMVGPVTGSSASSATASYDSRPVVLNRPFQSVAELGYVFRDTPWRSLDFINPQSGDSALLDVFCVYGPDPWSYAAKSYNSANADSTYLATKGLVAGRVNLNTRQVPVLASLLKGASTTTPTSNTSPLTVLNDSLTSPATSPNTAAVDVAKSLVGWTTSSDIANKGPLRNPAELVGKFVGGTSPATYKFSGFSSQLTALLSKAGPSGSNSSSFIKQQQESVVHALADSGTTRTWNLLIDLVAQTGQMSSSAATAGMGNFVVSGERHVWVSVAIDRATGKIIKMQIEPVRL